MKIFRILAFAMFIVLFQNNNLFSQSKVAKIEVFKSKNLIIKGINAPAGTKKFLDSGDVITWDKSTEPNTDFKIQIRSNGYYIHKIDSNTIKIDKEADNKLAKSNNLTDHYYVTSGVTRSFKKDNVKNSCITEPPDGFSFTRDDILFLSWNNKSQDSLVITDSNKKIVFSKKIRGINQYSLPLEMFKPGSFTVKLSSKINCSIIIEIEDTN